MLRNIDIKIKILRVCSGGVGGATQWKLGIISGTICIISAVTVYIPPLYVYRYLLIETANPSYVRGMHGDGLSIEYDLFYLQCRCMCKNYC